MLWNTKFQQKKFKKDISPFQDEGVVPASLSRPPSVSCSNFEPLMIWLRFPCFSPEVKRNYELPVLNFFSSSRDFSFLQFISWGEKNSQTQFSSELYRQTQTTYFVGVSNIKKFSNVSIKNRCFIALENFFFKFFYVALSFRSCQTGPVLSQSIQGIRML